MSGPQVVGQPAAERLMAALDYRLHPDARKLTPDEVAVVLHALADHTALLAAIAYSRPVDGHWPEATSVGRWLHDTADQLGRMPSDPLCDVATCPGIGTGGPEHGRRVLAAQTREVDRRG